MLGDERKKDLVAQALKRGIEPLNAVTESGELADLEVGGVPHQDRVGILALLPEDSKLLDYETLASTESVTTEGARLLNLLREVIPKDYRAVFRDLGGDPKAVEKRLASLLMGETEPVEELDLQLGSDWLVVGDQGLPVH